MKKNHDVRLDEIKKAWFENSEKEDIERLLEIIEFSETKNNPSIEDAKKLFFSFDEVLVGSIIMWSIWDTEVSERIYEFINNPD